MTITTASALCSASPTGRMRNRSTPAPRTKLVAMAAIHAAPTGSPHSPNCQARKTENIAISPWAKFRSPEVR